MPAGKAPIRGATGFLVKLPHSVSARSLLAFRLPRLGPPSVAEIKYWRGKVREAVSRYVGFSRSTVIVTGTVRSAVLRKIQTAAKRLVMALTKNGDTLPWANRLLRRLETDVATRDVVHRQLRDHGGTLLELQDLLKRLTWVGIMSRAGGAQHVVVQRVEAKLDKQRLIELLRGLADVAERSKAKASWTNPLLVMLIQDLSETWTRATGRSTLSTYPASDRKDFLFPEWVERIVSAALNCPTETVHEGSVVDIVRALNRQNPAPPALPDFARISLPLVAIRRRPAERLEE